MKGAERLLLSEAKWCGPLLNQLFFVEVSADIGRRSAASRQQTSDSTQAASAAKDSDGSKAAAEYKDDGWSRVKGVTEEPHFLRVFGRWVPFARGLHMWLGTDITPTPLRRLSTEATPAAEHQESHSLPAALKGFQGLAGNPGIGIAAPALRRGRSPYVYWRQSVLPPTVQSLCVALIKQPAADTGSFATSSKPSTVHIPESCDEAQRLLSSMDVASADAAWLSCGPQLELSRLTHFLTFMVPQEKMNQVLAALDYSVDVWREPHQVQSQHDLNNVTHATQRGEDPSQTPLNEGVADDIQQKQENSENPAENEQGIPPARDVEARRLAAVQREDETSSERPKWRVGVCLLKASQVASTDHNSSNQKTGSKPLSDQGNSSSNAAEAAPSSVRKDNAQNMRGAVEGLQAVREAQEKEMQKLALGSSADAQLVGELRFHVSPEIAAPHAEDEGGKGEIETIQIRHFIDAGWIYSRAVQGINLTRFNRLALKESTEGLGRPCSGFWEQRSLLGVAPEFYAWDETTQREMLKFNLRERLQRLVLVQQRDAVEQLLMRELGLTAEDREEQDDEDDEDEMHNCSA
ncbi:hypothetical protein Emed_006809 [Eimeria media]